MYVNRKTNVHTIYHYLFSMVMKLPIILYRNIILKNYLDTSISVFFSLLKSIKKIGYHIHFIYLEELIMNSSIA